MDFPIGSKGLANHGAADGGRRGRRWPWLAASAWLVLSWPAAAAAPAADADKLLREKCGACHLEGGKLQRISELRKTPEGWDMSIARMMVWHKVAVSKAERKILVKHLADRHGLAPQEAAPYRFLVEREPNAADVVPSEELGQMCGRCHSFGRIALQRRDEGEWRKLVSTHVGQFPGIEYSAFGRDRNWWEIARDKIPADLAARYPRQTKAWAEWKAKPWKSAAGTWRVSGNRPGWGDYSGYMKVHSLGRDRYEVSYDFKYANGGVASGSGESVVYTGYEWRGDGLLGGEAVRSVFAIDGDRLAGRWFLRQGDEIGARLTAVRVAPNSAPTVLSVMPAMIRVGETARLRINGINLGKSIDLGPDIEVVASERRQADEVELLVKVGDGAVPGVRTVGAAGGKGGAPLAVYREVNSLRVEPAFAIARLGGGTLPRVSAQFEAVAYLNGADGQPGTDDDIRLGVVPANWRIDNFDERAKAESDAQFAGHIEANGQFIPAAAGPNPARAGKNNIGDLKVIATLQDAGKSIDGEGHLIVAVQRWNTPPLR